MKFLEYIDRMLDENEMGGARIRLPLAQLGWNIRVPDPAPLDDEYRPAQTYLLIVYRPAENGVGYLGLETPGPFYPWEHAISTRLKNKLLAMLNTLEFTEGLDFYCVLMSK